MLVRCYDGDDEMAVPADFPPAIADLPPHEIYPGVFSTRTMEELREAFPSHPNNNDNDNDKECTTTTTKTSSFAFPGGGIFVHDNVLTPSECRAVVNASQAWYYDYERPGEFRVAHVNHLKLSMQDGSSPLVDRITSLMGVDSSGVPPVIPIKSITPQLKGLKRHADNGFFTEATTVVYFQDMHHSGGLAFPAKGVVVLPRAGRAVTLISRRVSGEPDVESIHHTMPFHPELEGDDEHRLSVALAVKLLDGATPDWFDAPHRVPAQKARPAGICHGIGSYSPSKRPTTKDADPASRHVRHEERHVARAMPAAPARLRRGRRQVHVGRCWLGRLGPTRGVGRTRVPLPVRAPSQRRGEEPQSSVWLQAPLAQRRWVQGRDRLPLHRMRAHLQAPTQLPLGRGWRQCGNGHVHAQGLVSGSVPVPVPFRSVSVGVGVWFRFCARKWSVLAKTSLDKKRAPPSADTNATGASRRGEP